MYTNFLLLHKNGRNVATRESGCHGNMRITVTFLSLFFQSIDESNLDNPKHVSDQIY